MLDALVWVVAAGFAGMGLYALGVPAGIPAFLGERLETADGRSEVRAVYGGFGLAVAAVLVAGTLLSVRWGAEMNHRLNPRHLALVFAVLFGALGLRLLFENV